MNKEELDQLYHNLRQLCVTDDIFQKEAVAGITSHLTQPQGDYIGLLRFLDHYGQNYILPHVVKLLNSLSHVLTFFRVVELGAGLGWLGRGLSGAFSIPEVFVDKRQWVLIDVVADIESKNGIKRVLDVLKEGDLIIMSELLHCLDDAKKTLDPFTKWPMLVVEYMPTNRAYGESYSAQIKKFGCKPVENIRDVFPGSKIFTAIAEPYMVWVILPL